jgi:hypothetical protein
VNEQSGEEAAANVSFLRRCWVCRGQFMTSKGRMRQRNSPFRQKLQVNLSSPLCDFGSQGCRFEPLPGASSEDKLLKCYFSPQVLTKSTTASSFHPHFPEPRRGQFKVAETFGPRFKGRIATGECLRGHRGRCLVVSSYKDLIVPAANGVSKECSADAGNNCLCPFLVVH